MQLLSPSNQFGLRHWATCKNPSYPTACPLLCVNIMQLAFPFSFYRAAACHVYQEDAGDTWCTVYQCISTAYSLVQKFSADAWLHPAQILLVFSCVRTLSSRSPLAYLGHCLLRLYFAWPGKYQNKIWGHRVAKVTRIGNLDMFSVYYNFIRTTKMAPITKNRTVVESYTTIYRMRFHNNEDRHFQTKELITTLPSMISLGKPKGLIHIWLIYTS